MQWSLVSCLAPGLLAKHEWCQHATENNVRSTKNCLIQEYNTLKDCIWEVFLDFSSSLGCYVCVRGQYFIHTKEKNSLSWITTSSFQPSNCWNKDASSPPLLKKQKQKTNHRRVSRQQANVFSSTRSSTRSVCVGKSASLYCTVHTKMHLKKGLMLCWLTFWYWILHSL